MRMLGNCYKIPLIMYSTETDKKNKKQTKITTTTTKTMKLFTAKLPEQKNPLGHEKIRIRNC